MVSHMPKVASFINYHSLVESCDFTNRVNSHSSGVEMHIPGKCYAILAAMLQSEVIVSKNVRPGHLGLSVHMPGKICLPVTETAPHTLTQDSVIVK